MGTYIAYTDLQNMTGSRLSSTILNAIIDNAEGELEGWFTELNVTGSASDKLCIAASMALSIVGLATRMRFDGSKPSSLRIGDLSMSDNVDAIIAQKRAEARAHAEAYARRSRGDARIQTEATDVDEVAIREDHEMKNYQLDQGTIHEYHERADEFGNEDP